MYNIRIIRTNTSQSLPDWDFVLAIMYVCALLLTEFL